jgi:hypothetical protein
MAATAIPALRVWCKPRTFSLKRLTTNYGGSDSDGAAVFSRRTRRPMHIAPATRGRSRETLNTIAKFTS